MNPNELTEATLRYALGWNEAVGQRIVIGILGVLVLILVFRALFRRHTGLIALLLWTLLGGIMVLFASMPETVIKTIISTEYMFRVRVAMGAISVIVLLITFESVRKSKLQERYALLWVATSLVILACVFFPSTVALFRAVTGMEYGAALAAVAFTFLTLVAFHFSISFSATQARIAKLTQKVALLEAQLQGQEGRAEAPAAEQKTKDAAVK